MKPLNICIVQPGKHVYSETFVRTHAEHLPGTVTVVYGETFPTHTVDGVRLADVYLKRNMAAQCTQLFCKILPAFIANKIPSKLKGYPFDEALVEVAFAHFLAHNKIDVVLAEFFLKGVIVQNVCTQMGVPLVVHTHGGGDIVGVTDIQWYGPMYPDFFKNVSYVITVDSFSAAQIIALGLPKEKLVTVGYGIDLNFFTQTSPADNPQYFFAVGRLADKKAPLITLLAFAKVLQRYSKAKLQMGGSGSLYDACLQLVKALKLEHAVEFLGVLTPQQVVYKMQHIKAFVQHSVHTTYGDSEGTPVAILEAMACGLPVISTMHNGIADNITHDVDGYLIPEYDVDAMAAGMCKVLEDGDYAKRLGAAARQKIANNFELHKTINNLHTVLQNAYSKK